MKAVTLKYTVQTVNEWRAGYSESCKSGSGASVRKPTAAMRQGAGYLAYSILCLMWTGRNTNSAIASMPSSGQHPTSCAGSTACRWWSSPRQRNRHGTPGCGKPSTKPVRMPVPPRTFTGCCIGKGTFSAVTRTEGTRPSGHGMAAVQCGFIGWEKNTIYLP